MSESSANPAQIMEKRNEKCSSENVTTNNQTLCDVHESLKVLVDIVELDFGLDDHRWRHLLEKRSNRSNIA
jgi:hypothetical protein